MFTYAQECTVRGEAKREMSIPYRHEDVAWRRSMHALVLNRNSTTGPMFTARPMDRCIAPIPRVPGNEEIYTAMARTVTHGNGVVPD